MNDLIKYLQQYAEGEPEIVLDIPLFSNKKQISDPKVLNRLDAVKKEALMCTRCQLAKTRQNVVFGDGSADARLMFIGEGPGADEDRQGIPFVGRAGQLLNKIIAAMKFQRSEVYIANIVKCRPPDNRDPLPEEAESCIPYLEQQIQIIDPDVIVALGKVAAVRLLNLDPGVSVKSIRNQIHNYKDKPFIVTYHPSYLLRTPSGKVEAWKDMQVVMGLLAGNIVWAPDR